MTRRMGPRCPNETVAALVVRIVPDGVRSPWMGLRIFLAVLGAVLAAPATVAFATGETRAAGDVVLSSRDSFISSNATLGGGVTCPSNPPDQKTGTGAGAFNESVDSSCSDATRSSAGSATQSATVTVTDGALAVDVSSAMSATASAPSGEVSEGRGRSRLSVNFSIPAGAGVHHYTLSGNVNVAGDTTINDARLDGPGGRLFERTGAGAFDSSGALVEGDYTFEIDVDADATGNPQFPHQSTSASGDFQLSLDVAGGAPPVAITAGPPALTNSSSAAFEFAIPGPPPPGHYECRIDDFGFAECSSPKTFTGVPEGAHTFEVRFVADGGEPGSASLRTWQVDTTPPTAIVDAAPSGDANASDVTVTFHSSEPFQATFDCALDSAQAVPCTSPLRLTGLARGSHVLGIRAIDAAGNIQGGETSVLFGVAASSGFPVPPASCTGSSVGKVTFGPIVAIATSPEACMGVERIDGRQVRVSRGIIYVNGLKVTPKANTKIIVDGVLGGGTVRSTGPVAVTVGSLGFNIEELRIDSLQRASELRALGIVSGALLSLGAPVAPPTVEFSADNGGQTKFNVSLKLPRVFTALPASAGQSAEQADVTGDLGAVASNNLGVFFTGKMKLSDLWLKGKVKLKDLTLGFDQGSGTLEGSVGLALAKGAVHPPGISEDAVLTASVSIGSGGFLGALRKFGLDVSNLAVHIGYGFFFQRVGGSLEQVGDDLKTSFTGGASWGPKLDIEVGGVKIFEGEIASFDGAYTLKVPSSVAAPVVVGATGQGKLFDIPLVDAALTYSNPGGIALTGTYDYTIAGYGFVARIDRAWFDPATDDFSTEASGESRLPPVVDALVNDNVDVVVSKTGFAACFGENGEAVGFTRTWGEELDFWVDGCDVGPFRRGPAAAAAQTGGARSFAIPARARVAVVEVGGLGAPPKVVLKGPDGTAPIQSPATSGLLRRGGVLLVEDARRSTTTVVLRRPAAGTWEIAALPGSTLTSVRVADGLPPITIAAKVSGRGERRTFTWRAKGTQGHKLTFVERGRGGSVRRLTSTTKAVGRLRFAPSPLVTGTQRRIEAIVTRRSVTRTTRIVARFTAKLAPPGRASGIRRCAKQLTWKPVPRAASYAVALRLSDGRTLPLTTRRTRLSLPPKARKGKLTVTIVAIDAATRPGRAATARIG